jgi:hypothetical protein
MTGSRSDGGDPQESGTCPLPVEALVSRHHDDGECRQQDDQRGLPGTCANEKAGDGPEAVTEPHQQIEQVHALSPPSVVLRRVEPGTCPGTGERHNHAGERRLPVITPFGGSAAVAFGGI